MTTKSAFSILIRCLALYIGWLGLLSIFDFVSLLQVEPRGRFDNSNPRRVNYVHASIPPKYGYPPMEYQSDLYMAVFFRAFLCLGVSGLLVAYTNDCANLLARGIEEPAREDSKDRVG